MSLPSTFHDIPPLKYYVLPLLLLFLVYSSLPQKCSMLYILPLKTFGSSCGCTNASIDQHNDTYTITSHYLHFTILTVKDSWHALFVCSFDLIVVFEVGNRWYVIESHSNHHHHGISCILRMITCLPSSARLLQSIILAQCCHLIVELCADTRYPMHPLSW